MAKTIRQIDWSQLYKTGVFYSFCLHSVLFFILGLIYFQNISPIIKPVKIEFNESVEPIQEIVFEEIKISNNIDDSDFDSKDIVDQNLIPNPDTPNIVNINSSDISLDTISFPTNDLLNDESYLSANIIESSSATQFEAETGGELGELKRRLKKYGAKTGDIQISLSWDTKDDLDLHVLVRPYMSHICWYAKLDGYGGELDIDMNADEERLTDQPIENVYWLKNNRHRKNSNYTISVNFYRQWTKNNSIKALVVLKRGSHIESKNITVSINDPMVEVFSFTR